MPVLTAIDLLGIQRFIFGSNRLRDVVGASRLVARSCSWDAEGPLGQGVVRPDWRLMAAGGNALLVVPDLDQAQTLAGRFSRWLHDEAPGLEAVIVHRAFDGGDLLRALRALQVDVARAKTERRPSVPLLGLSVTASCRETGLPAVGFSRLGNEPAVPASRGTLRVRDAYDGDRASQARANQLGELAAIAGLPLDFPRELDMLGRTHGDTSLIGVVHVDGNGVGVVIEDWLQRCDGLRDDVAREQYRAWSSALDSLADRAMMSVLRRAASAIRLDEEGHAWIAGERASPGFELWPATDDQDDGEEDDPKGAFLPVRPILVGGDDLTFVCDGRLALTLAQAALEAFDRSDIAHLGRVPACAGVAIVRSHAPFSRAYELAEGLCREAKGMLRAQKARADCAIDWHVGATRPGETVRSIRERQYASAARSLTARPLRLGNDAGEVGTWRWLDTEMLGAASQTSLRGPVWKERRNKVKALRELVREGPAAVQASLEAWRIVDRKLVLPSAISTGFSTDGRTPLLDAIELLDIHLSLPASP